MKRKRLNSADYQEDYLLNSLEFDPHFPGLQIHSFCHSFYAPQLQISRNYTVSFLLVYMILSGSNRYTSADGDRILQNQDYFSVTDMNYQSSGVFVEKREQTLERYFVLFHTNRILHDVLLNLFPCGLPNFKPRDPARIKRCFEDIRRVLRRTGKTDESLLGAMGYQLLAEAASQLETVAPERDILTKAKRYIEDRYCDPLLTRKEIAFVAKINEATLGRLFQETFHTTVNQYVISLRLKKAQFLLKNTQLSIAEIAKQCGFTYAYYFSKVFKERMGILPGKYRSLSD